MNEQCAHWNEYWDSLNDKEKPAINKELKDSREMESFFQEATHSHDRSVLALARSIMSTGGDNSLLSSVMFYSIYSKLIESLKKRLLKE